MSVLRLNSLQTKSRMKTLTATLSATMIAMMLSGNANALEDGFIGLQAGSASSLDAETSGSSFKVLAGAHVTSRITLEAGYVNFGTSSFSEPKAENLGVNNKNITFSDAKHGNVSIGQLGQATVNPTSGDIEYKNKDNAVFTGISDFATQGGLINIRYRFPIMDEFDFFVKTGFFAWFVEYDTVKVTASQNPNSVDTVETKSGRTSAVNAISGAGFIYRPTSGISFRAELESTAISSVEMPRTRLQNISVGVNWEF